MDVDGRGWRVLVGDVRERLRDVPDGVVQCCVTSPPYWGLRDYGTAEWDGGDAGCDHRRNGIPKDNESPGRRKSTLGGSTESTTAAAEGALFFRDICGKCGARRIDRQIGQEPTPAEYVSTMVGVMDEVRRVLRDDGCVYLNVGDSYAGSGKGGNPPDSPHRGFVSTGTVDACRDAGGKTAIPPGLKPKDLCLIPWRLAIALQDAGWWVRSVICWHKLSCMPESVVDRPTNSWEPIFLLAKSERYFWDSEAVKEKSVDVEGSAHRYKSEFFQTGKHAAGYGRPDGAANTAGVKVFDGTRNQRNVWSLGPEPFSGWVKTSRQVRVASDDACDGMTRKSSEDCPVHGNQDRQDGEREGCPSIHNHGTCDRLSQEPHHEPDTSSECPALSMSESSSDSQSQPCAAFAKPRSSRSRKTARVPETNSPCTPCVEKADGTECTSESPASSFEDPDIDESTVSEDDSVDSSDNQTPDGNADKQDELNVSEASYRSYVGEGCTCSFYKTETKETSHFAVFPSSIPKRAILAGTSERGCCPACRAPWRRVVEKSLTGVDERRPDNGMPGRTGNGMTRMRAGDPESRTVGWEPSCTCDAGEPIPCIVLDPFNGSGTSGMVATELGREYIGCELNPEYAEMSRRRIESWKTRDASKAAEPLPGQMSLFE